MAHEPHFIPGYTGHCPQSRFREGKTYGQLTHKLLLDPCIHHAPKLILCSTIPPAKTIDYPTEEECDILKGREYFVDAVYKHPLIPGYNGFIPNFTAKLGKRYAAAATAGVAEHTIKYNQQHCENRHLVHRDLLESGIGVFEHKLRERMMPMTKYRAPLTPVRPRSQAVKLLKCPCKQPKEPYSKFTVPHFMEIDDEEKYITSGYGGHVPLAASRFGQSSKQLTNSALCEFVNNYHHRRSAEWCPIELAGIGSSCPSSGHFVIYHKNIGLVPSYAGHVPGEAFTFGSTYGNATVNAKNWLDYHKAK